MSRCLFVVEWNGRHGDERPGKGRHCSDGELLQRDNVDLDLSWLRERSLGDSVDLRALHPLAHCPKSLSLYA